MKDFAIGQIRFDHTHVTATFHRYNPHSDPKTKEGLARYICIALKIHTALEEEIFYPAMRKEGIDPSVIDSKNMPQHAEQHRLIDKLETLQVADPNFEQIFMELMRATFHHVADEETMLLADAERRVSRERLNELGKEMTKRRMELSAEYGVDMASSLNQATSSTAKLLAGGALLAGSFMIGRALSRDGGSHRHM
jgi:hypothetical protein